MADDRYQDEPRPRLRREEEYDGGEELPRGRRVRRDDDDGGVNALIPYKNPKALIAYYLGVFSLIPCLGLPLAVGAVVLGVLGLGHRRRYETAGGTGHAWAGIVLGSLVLIGTLGAVIAMFVLRAS